MGRRVWSAVHGFHDVREVRYVRMWRRMAKHKQGSSPDLVEVVCKANDNYATTIVSRAGVAKGALGSRRARYRQGKRLGSGRCAVACLQRLRLDVRCWVQDRQAIIMLEGACLDNAGMCAGERLLCTARLLQLGTGHGVKRRGQRGGRATGSGQRLMTRL